MAAVLRPDTRRVDSNPSHSCNLNDLSTKTDVRNALSTYQKIRYAHDMHTTCEQKVTMNLIQITNLYLPDLITYESMDSSCINFIYLAIPGLFF